MAIPRAHATGVAIPNVKSWKLEVLTETSAIAATYESDPSGSGPGGIIGIKWSLDGLGLLSAAQVDSVIPLPYEPFSNSMRLTLKDDALEEFIVWEGYIKNVSTGETTNGSGAVYTFELGGLHELIMRKYWYGFADTFPPKVPRLSITSTYNMLGIDVPDIGAFIDPYMPNYSKINKSVKVSEVMEKALESFPDGTWGIDGERRMLIGRPQDGTPVIIQAKDVIGLRQGQYEIPPYITEMRSDSGPGWGGYVYKRGTPAVYGFVPEVAQDSNGTTGTSVTTPKGPHWRAAKITPNPHYVVKVDADFVGAGHRTFYPEAEIVDGYGGEDFYDADINGTQALDMDISTLPNRFTMVSKSGICYLIADVQAWYEQSSLFKEGSSNYEPIQAAFPVDLQVEHVPYKNIQEGSVTQWSYDVTVDAIVWISDSPTYDLAAVGKPGTPIFETVGSRTGGVDGYGNPLPDTFFNQIKGIEGPPSVGPIYPFESAHTIAVLSSSRMVITAKQSDVQQPVSLTFAIDSKWFKEDQRQVLIDNGWTGDFFYHIGFSFAVTTNDDPVASPSPAYKDPTHPDGTAAGRAKVTYTIREPIFSQKEQGSPEWDVNSVGLEYPFFTGPNYEGWYNGILIPPARIVGDFYKSTAEPRTFGNPRPGLVTVNQYVAGVDCELTPEGAKSALRTNVLPYKRFDPWTYNRRY